MLVSLQRILILFHFYFIIRSSASFDFLSSEPLTILPTTQRGALQIVIACILAENTGVYGASYVPGCYGAIPVVLFGAWSCQPLHFCAMIAPAPKQRLPKASPEGKVKYRKIGLHNPKFAS